MIDLRAHKKIAGFLAAFAALLLEQELLQDIILVL